MKLEKEKNKTIIETVVSKKPNPRTGKYYEKEVETNKPSSRQGWSGKTTSGVYVSRNINSSGENYYDEDIYTYVPSNYESVKQEPEKERKTLQEYLNNEYPTKETKEKVKEIRLNKINEKRKGKGLLEGGELDLSEYTKLEWISLDGELLKTPLVRINLSGVNGLEYSHLINNAFCFSEVKTLWDKHFLLKYDYWKDTKYGYPTFRLIEVEELSYWAYQLNENNWQDHNFIKHFGIDEDTVDFLKKNNKDIVYSLLDNLATQIVARCVVVSNRLTHGEDKESEKNIMRLSLEFSKEIPEPKEKNKNVVGMLVGKTLAKVPELLTKLENLPWKVEQLESKIEILPKN